MTTTPTMSEPTTIPAPPDSFVPRHIGPTDADVKAMLEVVGYDSLDALIEATVPADIRLDQPMTLPGLPGPLGEHEAIERLRAIAAKNTVAKSMIGMGYHGTITPPVILRNVLEDPRWYTPYTPYQAEISQGRLEALLNFQTMVSDLTGLPLAGASLLDEATAAAEAMAMCYAVGNKRKKKFLVANDCHPQTIAVVKTRAWSMGIEAKVVGREALIESPRSASVGFEGVCGILVQYPATDGCIPSPDTLRQLCGAAHDAGALVVAATDLLACCLITPPGEWGADVCVGSSQRFGVPMGYGGPHAAFISTHEKYARKMPGRLIGVSKDAQGNPAYRMAIQTREQHIKRDKATSNICTAQVLLAITAGMYAVYHGPEGLKRIAERVHGYAWALADALRNAGITIANEELQFFDAVSVLLADADAADAILVKARGAGFNLRIVHDNIVNVVIDETTTHDDLQQVASLFSEDAVVDSTSGSDHSPFATRHSPFLTHPVFNSYHSEHELLRYLNRLIGQDIGLDRSMVPLGSCTMKLNAAAEMIPVTWPAFANLHPYCPPEQAAGYAQLFKELETWLAEITGFAATSLQPNAGSQGEYAGLLAIRRYHEARGDMDRDACLIPTSAHGTNPASAVIAGFRVVPVKCDSEGNIDLDDLRAKAAGHADRLGALMITYPSTHGVFETGIREACAIIHEHGGQVYMDGANMNAQVGLTSPGEIGADVCHLNLHKTFCIPHGGGGPGMGPICVAEHLKGFLPGNPTPDTRNPEPGFAVSAAPYGSPMILPISYAYIAMMGAAGLTRASKIAILNANYLAARLREHYDVLYTGPADTVAHEGIIDCRPFEKSAGVRVEDIAKRLMDFGFHAPTMSWPVAGTMMIEPTESESKAELDRFCDAMITIRQEIAAIEADASDPDDNPLKHAPHTAAVVTSDDWPHTYSRKQAAYPVAWLEETGRKYWPPVARIDNAHGDRNLVCTCPSVDELAE